jgi:hypothetical protein
MDFVLRGVDGQLYAVRGPTRMGRDTSCAIRVSDQLASRLHALVWFTSQGLHIRDQGSSNGTFVNGAPLQPNQAYHLREGDQIRIGTAVFTVIVQAEPNTAQPPAMPVQPPPLAASAAGPVCPHCGRPLKPGKNFCTQCGTLSKNLVAQNPAVPGAAPRALPPTTSLTLCRQCGKPLRPGKNFCATCGAALQPAVTPNAAHPRKSGLAALGLELARGQVVSTIAAAVAGLIIARVLPYVYFVFDPALTAVFGAGPSYSRDSFNQLMMTSITFCSSFLVAFVAALWWRPKPKRA